MKKLLSFILHTPYYILLTTYYLFPQPVYAQGDLPPSICDLEGIFESILRFALGFAGLALFIVFIFGGYKWLTAGTNEKAVQEARKTFTYGIVGLVLTIGSWFILRFIESFTGIQVTIFQIPNC